MEPISESIKRFDFDDKITGKALYAADVRFENMIYAKTLRSKVAKAKINNINIPPLPKGYCIVDHHDIPFRNVIPIVYDDQPIFAVDQVNYIGEPILLVVGPDKQVILDILNQIIVEVQPLEPILSIQQAQAIQDNGSDQTKPYHVTYTYTKGNLHQAKANAVYQVKDTCFTGYQEHAYLETQGMIARYEDPIITVWGSMQCPYYVVEALKSALGWQQDRICVVQMATGGAFGGKEDFPSIPGVHAALAAIKTNQPVQLIYDRQEDIESSTKRHPSMITIESYLDKDHTIIGRDIEVAIDGGAYAGLSSVVLQRSIFSVAGVYNIENLQIKGTAYITNQVVSGAFRGFGGPQAFFAIEVHMDHIAKEINEDPIRLRQKYFLKQGDTSSTQGVFHDPICLDQIIHEIVNMSDFKTKHNDYKHQPNKGIGISVFFHGCGFTGAGEPDLIHPTVRLVKENDRVKIYVSSTEIGQGALTTLRKIVANTLKIDIHQIDHDYPDSQKCPDSGPTVASRTALIVGKLVQNAAEKIKQRWDEAHVEIIQAYEYPTFLFWDNKTFIGNAYPDFSWGANVVEVEVDPLTYQIEVKTIWGVYDIGTPLDLRIVQGQLEGGILQGLGYATSEVLTPVDGRLSQDTLTTYIIPTAQDAPSILTRLIDNPSTIGPFGARGLGELPLVGVAPALANAVAQAVGYSIDRIPITPESIKR